MSVKRSESSYMPIIKKYTGEGTRGNNNHHTCINVSGLEKIIRRVKLLSTLRPKIRITSQTNNDL